MAETTIWDYLSLWLAPENFWLILGSLLIYYLRALKPVLEKSTQVLDKYLIIEEKRLPLIQDVQRHREETIILVKRMDDVEEKIDVIHEYVVEQKN